jgi:hypothetical protein
MLIVTVDQGFGCKKFQTYSSMYNDFFEIWLQTFFNLPIAKFDREDLKNNCNSWMVNSC